MTMMIGDRKIGLGEKPYFIADIAANHDGDINRAFKLIELAKEAGADCAKFQNFKAKTIVSKNGFETMQGQLSHQKGWQKSVFETYEDASIFDEWTPRLKEKCDEVGIEYMTSPYDYDSVDWADKYVNAFKIGSGDITWTDIIKHMAAKGKPILLATGASDLEDVKRALSAIMPINNQIVLMQCNTNYTASAENFKYINLNVLNEYGKLYPDAVLGLSDHTFGHTTVLGAYALGARVFEKHFTDDNDRVGPDHKFSMNPATWRQMVDAAMALYYAMGDGVKKVEDNEVETVIVQRRCFYYTRNMKAGEQIKATDVYPLRPVKENAVLPYEKDGMIGKILIKDAMADTPVIWEDFK